MTTVKIKIDSIAPVFVTSLGTGDYFIHGGKTYIKITSELVKPEFSWGIKLNDGVKSHFPPSAICTYYPNVELKLNE
jgi:hypothetical protein